MALLSALSITKNSGNLTFQLPTGNPKNYFGDSGVFAISDDQTIAIINIANDSYSVLITNLTVSGVPQVNASGATAALNNILGSTAGGVAANVNITNGSLAATIGNLPSGADSTVATLAAVTAGTYFSADQTSANGRFLFLGINITSSAGGTGTIFVIQGKDVASGNYYDILSSASLSAAALSALFLGAGIQNNANVSIGLSLPKTWRVKYVVSAGTTISATIGASVTV